jgi:drug/metabolite transporter (DMT)-like permease
VSAGHSAKTGGIDVLATGACLGALGCWSIGPIFIEYLTGYIDSWSQNALRYSVSCLFWFPFLLSVVRKGTFDHRTWRRAILPAVANVVMQSFYAAAYYYIGPAFLALLSKTSVLWVAGFSLLFFREERPLAASKRFWLGFALALMGLFGVLYYEAGFSATGTRVGIALALLMGLMWAVYTISVRIAFQDIDSRSSFSVISLYTSIGLWIGALTCGDPGRALAMGPGPWAAVVISGVTAIALGHTFYYSAIRRIGATIPMLVILTQPFVVLGLSNMIFGERLNGPQLLSGALLLIGAALSIWAQQHLQPRSAAISNP